MKLAKQEANILTPTDTIKSQILVSERAARTCYNSVDRQTCNYEDAVKFLKGLLEKHHESVIEHCSFTIEFITNIGVSREFERHRNTHFNFETELMTAFSEQSTRYCDYSKDARYPHGIEFCLSDAYLKELEELGYTEEYMQYLTTCENMYKTAKDKGSKAQTARHSLPLATKTKFIVTANLREWRWIIKQRTSNAAHPDIRELIGKVYDKLCDIGLKELLDV